MNKVVLKPYDVVIHEDLPELTVDQLPGDGDPLEIDGQLYFVCEQNEKPDADYRKIGVIPLVVRDPAKISDIRKYIDCLSLAHRKVQFINDKGATDLENCNKMVIS